MLFSDPAFFAFFVAYFCLHVVTPPRFRLYLLIGGSTIFYAWWRLDYVWVPYLLGLIAWGGVRWTEGTKVPERRKLRLIVTLLLLFIPLVVFKYTNFLVFDVIGAGMAVPGIAADKFRFALPLGISFVTFTLTAFVVDVYRGQFPVERRLSVILGYVLFFPHLIAGPILRPHELIPQLLKSTRALDARFTLGAAIFVVGLSKN